MHKKLGMTPLLQRRLFVAKAEHHIVPLVHWNEALLVHIQRKLQHLLFHLHCSNYLHQVSSFWSNQVRKSLVKPLVLTSRHVSQTNPLLDLVSTCLMQSFHFTPSTALPQAHARCQPAQLPCCPWTLPSDATAITLSCWMRPGAPTAQDCPDRDHTSLIHNTSTMRHVVGGKSMQDLHWYVQLGYLCE